MFDLMLDINFDYYYVFFNRGIVLYYGGCLEFVVVDLEKFV